MSDPSQSWNNFLRGSFKRSGIRKSRSETENVDIIGDGTSEVEATHIEDGTYFLAGVRTLYESLFLRCIQIIRKNFLD